MQRLTWRKWVLFATDGRNHTMTWGTRRQCYRGFTRWANRL